MTEGILDIGFWQLASAYIFVLILLILVRWRGISREKEVVIASARMTLQLVLVGYVLSFIFENDHPTFPVLFLFAMLVFSVFNIFKRVKAEVNDRLKWVIACSLAIGAVSSLLYFILVVLTLDPWYNSRYFIPIAGMIVGNSMTGISLGVKHLVEGVNAEWDTIEGALMLGAEPKDAVRHIVNAAFDSAILPTINSMVGMGIVFLPGMMTGQILSGVSPVTAIQYQIAIMLGILGGVSFTVILAVSYGYRTFFNNRSQLVGK